MGWLRKIAWGLLWKWIKARLMEKTTWVGLFALLAALGVPVNPELQDKLAYLLAESVEGDFWQVEYLQAAVTIVGALLGGTLIGIKEKGKEKDQPAENPLAETTFGAGESGRLNAEQVKAFKAELDELDAKGKLEIPPLTPKAPVPPEPRPLSDKVKNAKPRKGRGGRR
ncbi:hypothetical protein PU634_10375 [Oceanimonas pelagia]|uniref:Uncharacterized protein n=1 Tax=Oceanimonas pelagia TaxID=3028314 RepID=A0AA50QAY0_9GAMM|nr:hypothetical protein [Oceanimonas pelagia]WMC09521.1 hypothetical protein PU634_10375 [Oceanimonas pelagia]